MGERWLNAALTSTIDYFTKLLEDDLKAVVKPQYVDQIPRAIRSADKSVKTLIEGRLSMDNLDEVVDTLGELHVLFSVPSPSCANVE